MDIIDIENRSIDELRQGYYLDAEGCHCIHCDFASDGVDVMENHQEAEHRRDREALFLQLINSDDLLDASYDQKQVYYRIYKGMSDNAIAKELNMNVTTVRSHRYQLRRKNKAAKAMVWLCEMMNLEKQSEGETPPEDGDLIPGLDLRGNVKGFYSKHQLHETSGPIPHCSVLLLVSQRHSDGVMRYLACTKSSKVLTYAGKPGFHENQIKKRWLDIEGGHCRQSDSKEIVIGKPLPEDIFRRAAERSLGNEVYLKKDKPDKTKLIYLYTDETGPGGRDLYPIKGQNIEKTGVFLYRLPDGIPRSSIMVRDRWVDSTGSIKTKRFPSEFVTWEELEEYSEPGSATALMDGAQRVVDRMKQDAGLKTKMLELLENGLTP